MPRCSLCPCGQVPRCSGRCDPFAGTSANLRAGRSLTRTRNGRLWTRYTPTSVVCNHLPNLANSLVVAPGSCLLVLVPSHQYPSGIRCVGWGWKLGLPLCDGWKCCTWQHSWSDTVHACGPNGVVCTKSGVDASSLPKRQPSTGTRQIRGGAVKQIVSLRVGVDIQAINGLDEGVWNRTVGDLGPKR